MIPALMLTMLLVAQPATAERTGVQRALAEAETLLAQAPLLPVSPHPFLAPDVKDPVFAYMIGLLDHNQYGAVLSEHFEKAVETRGQRSSIPHHLIRELRRARGIRPNAGWVRAAFTKPLKVPVPYSILGYHPGSLVSSEEVIMEEWRIPQTSVPNPDPEGHGPLVLEDLTLWGVVGGEIKIDIHGWLDALMGGKLDDTYIVGLALFRFQDVRYAMALGFNSEGQGQSGALEVQEDKIRFPSPKELQAIGRDLRGRVIRRLARRGIPAWVPPADRP